MGFICQVIESLPKLSFSGKDKPGNNTYATLMYSVPVSIHLPPVSSFWYAQMINSSFYLVQGGMHLICILQSPPSCRVIAANPVGLHTVESKDPNDPDF